MNQYELLYLIDVPPSDNELETISGRIKNLINEVKGNIVHEGSLGRKKLGYPVNKLQQGVYNVVEFDLPTGGLTKLGQVLKLDNDIIRYQIIKIRPRTEADRQPAKFETEEEQTPKPVKKELPVKSPPAAKEKPVVEEPMISKEELDKKLDEILEDDIIK
ncbi:30S ribosomal protein S6 [Patescibacteria group bacterium]